MLILAGIWILSKTQVEASFRDMLSTKGLIALSGVLSLIVGLAIAIGHPVWEWSFRGLITFIGYLSISQGIVRLAYPNEVEKFATKILHRWYWIPLLVLVIVGGFLTYHGFAK